MKFHEDANNFTFDIGIMDVCPSLTQRMHDIDEECYVKSFVYENDKLEASCGMHPYTVGS